MFGASEDRARQLAYRKRRDRVISGNSCSTYRSLSFASRISQQPHTCSALEHDAEHSPQQFHGVPNVVEPLLATDLQHSQAEQQRLQAEYLSQVLYNDISFADIVGTSQPVSTLRSSKYKSLEHPTTSRHSRNITAPIAYAEIQAVLASFTHSHLDLPVVRDHFRGQTMVSLRGGYDNVPEKQDHIQPPPASLSALNDRPLQTQQSNQLPFRGSGTRLWPPPPPPPTPITQFHDLGREYMHMFVFPRFWYFRSEWTTPILAGQNLANFRSLLLSSDASTFFSLFGPSEPPTQTRAPQAIARQRFYQQLGPLLQSSFREIITGRGREFRALEQGQHDPQALTLPNQSNERVMIYHMLEALEDPIGSSHYYGPTDHSQQMGRVLGTYSPSIQPRRMQLSMRPLHTQSMTTQITNVQSGMMSTQDSNAQTSAYAPPIAQHMATQPSISHSMYMQLQAAHAQFRAQQIQEQQKQPLNAQKAAQPLSDSTNIISQAQKVEGVVTQSSNAHSITLRGSSAPDFRKNHYQSGPLGSTRRKKQQEQSGYYSGGSGTNGSTAAKNALNKIFDKYRENANEPDNIGAEGTVQYLEDLGVDLEGLESVAALEIVQAPAMGEMTRSAFVNGWQERTCETIDKQKTYIKNLKRDLPGNRDLFERIYKYSFNIAKAANSKQAPLEQAIAFWDLLFSSPISAIQWKSVSTPWLDWWKEFLETSFKKSVNKDMWNETLKFAKLTLEDENMTFWTEESSWPSVIDEFVGWVKNEKRGGAKDEKMDEEY